MSSMVSGSLGRTRWLCVTALGVALFVVLSLCLKVPVFENYYLCLGYMVMAVYCYSFGAVSGTLVGVLGAALYCVVIGGLRGMPGWVLANVVIGIALGIAWSVMKKLRNRVLRLVTFVLVVVIFTAVGVLGVKSLVECLLYAQPFLVRCLKNVYAFVADVVVLLVSWPLCVHLGPVVELRFGIGTGSKVRVMKGGNCS